MKAIHFLPLILLAGCGSTHVKKKIELPPLPADAPVEVFMDHPNFRYDVICDINITRRGDFISTTREAYRSNVEVEARKCGANMAFIQSLIGTTSNVTVTGYAIKKLSDADKLVDMEGLKRLGRAANLDNLEVTKKIIQDLEVNKDRDMRSPNDDTVLQFLIYENAKLGSNCPKKVINYLMKDYNVRLMKFDFKTGALGSDPRKVAACELVLKDSYPHFYNRPALLSYVNNYIVGILNYYSGSREDLIGLQKINGVLPLVMKEIKDTCAKDATSEVCSFKPRFQEIRGHIQKILPKVKDAPVKKQLNNLYQGIRV